MVLKGFQLLLSSTGLSGANVISGITHWGRVTHICVSKQTSIGSDNGLSSGRNSYIFIQEIAFQNVVWKMAAILSRPQFDKSPQPLTTLWRRNPNRLFSCCIYLWNYSLVFWISTWVIESFCGNANILNQWKSAQIIFIIGNYLFIKLKWPGN